MGNGIYLKMAIKGGTPCPIFFREEVCNDEGYICYFFTEVIKFYWLMLLLYPGELYRLLGASSSLIWTNEKNLGRGYPFNVSYQNCCKKKHICQWFSKFSFRYFTFCNRVASLWLFEQSKCWVYIICKTRCVLLLVRK
jgi:hypothetical protein